MNEAEVGTVEEIHRSWWAANQGLDAEGMTRDLSDDFLMWNLNGHPYLSRAELDRLLEHYRRHLVPPESPQLWDVRVVCGEDLAYVTAEGVLPVMALTEGGAGAALIERMAGCYEQREGTIRFRFRETMVLRREPAAEHGWEVCHFHCSPLAPADEQRPGFGDTETSRGRRGETVVVAESD